MAPIDSLTSAHAFTSFRPKSRGADFSLDDSWPRAREPWTGRSVTLLSPLAHSGGTSASGTMASNANGALLTSRPRSGPKRPAGSPGNSPRRFITVAAHAPGVKRTETGSPAMERKSTTRIVRVAAVQSASPRTHSPVRDATGSSGDQCTAGHQSSQPGSPVHSSGSVGAGAATAAAARKESASRRPSSPPPPLPTAHLVWTQEKWKQLLGPAATTTTTWVKPSILTKMNTLALFTNLFEEVSPQRKRRGQRKKPKQNPFDSEEETEYESYTEEEGGGEGEDEGWSEHGGVENVEAGTPRPKSLRQQTSRQLLGSTYGDGSSSKEGNPQKGDGNDSAETPTKRTGNLASRTAKVAFTGPSSGPDSAHYKSKHKQRTKEASRQLGGAESGKRRRLPFADEGGNEADAEQEPEPPPPPAPPEKITGFGKFS